MVFSELPIRRAKKAMAQNFYSLLVLQKVSHATEFHCGKKASFHFIHLVNKVPDINCLVFQVMAVDLTQSGDEFGGEISITRGPNFETAVL